MIKLKMFFLVPFLLVFLVACEKDLAEPTAQQIELKYDDDKLVASDDDDLQDLGELDEIDETKETDDTDLGNDEYADEVDNDDYSEDEEIIYEDEEYDDASNTVSSLFVRDLADVAGVWQVSSDNVISSDKLFYPAQEGLPNVKFIKIDNGNIQLLDDNGNQILNSFAIDNVAFGTIIVNGLFDVELGSVTSRIVVFLTNGKLKLSQYYSANFSGGVEYMFEKI